MMWSKVGVRLEQEEQGYIKVRVRQSKVEYGWNKVGVGFLRLG